VDRRERLAVHPPGEQDLGPARLVERDRATEGLDRHGVHARVRADEADVRGIVERAGDRQHVGERDAGPRGRPGRTGTPRRLARDVADRHQPCAPVPGTLQRRDHLALPERLAQRRQREVQLALHEAVDAQAPGLGVDLRDRPVAAHVERVVGGQRALGQGGRPRLGVERRLLVDDQLRPLSVVTHGPILPDTGRRFMRSV
jgi:hypothetical protein